MKGGDDVDPYQGYVNGWTGGLSVIEEPCKTAVIAG